MADRIYIVDNRYYNAAKAAFGQGRTMLPSVTCPGLAEPVASHPDMVLFAAGRGEVICAREVFDEYTRLLSPFGIHLVQGKSQLMRDYPGDVAYNVLNTPKGAFARFDKTDRTVTEALRAHNKKMVTVKQGYARCATVCFGNCLITADPTISAAAKEAGLSVLTVSPGGVLLPGYDYGFLGGASGLLDEKTVAFFGDVFAHPDGEKIQKFITENGFFISCIPQMPLTDIGTIFCIEL